MKKIGLCLLISLVGIFVFSGSVPAYTINDNTLVGRGQTKSTDYYNQVDNIGSGYQLYGLDVTVTTTGLLIDIYTDFDGGDGSSGVQIGLADLALDLDRNGTYEYGVDLTTTETTITSSGVYKNVVWTTSYDFMENKTSGNWWYGEFWGDSITAPSPIVEIDTGDNVGVAGSSRTLLTNHEAGYKYSVSIDLSVFGSDFNESEYDFGLFFATSTCANDIIEGTKNLKGNGEVPLPPTVLLLGSSLFCLVGLRRKLSG